MEKIVLIPPDYTPVQITVPDNKECVSIYNIWSNIYYTNIDSYSYSYSYISHVSLARKYNLIYTLIKTDKLKFLKYPYTTVPTSSAENIDFYKLNNNIYLLLKEENDIQEMTDIQGKQIWFKDGEYHRDNDLPALIYHDGRKEWFKNGSRHRDNDLPALILSDGTQVWYKNGLRHRDNDLPAVIYKDGRKLWYKKGIRYDYPS